MFKKSKPLGLNDPLKFDDHPLPKSRRDFLRQGFITGPAVVLGGGIYSMFSNPREAAAGDLGQLAAEIGCNLGGSAGNNIPFICFDLAGGANFASSNVIVGTKGQMDLLSTAAYSKMGLPGDIIPGLSDTNLAGTMQNQSISTDQVNDGMFMNGQLGLRFHTDSSMLTGILEKFTLVPTLAGFVDGAVIPARSGNDTSNNPHNPLYGIAKAGASGKAVTLIGSRNTESGGNSMSPSSFVNPEVRPTKVDRPSDVTGMVDVSDLTDVFNTKEDVTAVMESMARISHKKLKKTSTGLPVTEDEVIKDLVRCGYLKSAEIAKQFAGEQVDPAKDARIVGDSGIFNQSEFDGEGEFRKTASVMKMVIDKNAGAGSITMGGFDYHTGDRQAGEARDLRAGRCIGACLEYAAIVGSPLMIYVFSDGSVASNGSLDNSAGGRGKGVWTGDNSSTACSFFLVFDPNGGISKYSAKTAEEDHRQIGRFNAGGSVVTSATPAANNVNLLVNTVIANYMSLNGNLLIGDNSFNFETEFANHGLGSVANYVSFNTIPIAAPAPA